MTTPHERTRAVLEARDFFQDLARPDITSGVPEELRRQARWFLRHFPAAAELDLMHKALPNWFGSPAEVGSPVPPFVGAARRGRQAGDTTNLAESLGWTGKGRRAHFAPLTLAPGPALLCMQRPGTAGEAGSLGTDITARADEFLFEHVTLAEGVTLADVLGLLKRCPALQRVLRCESMAKVAVEARQGPRHGGTSEVPAEQTQLEYLELVWDWGMDTNSGRFTSVHRLDLNGVGPALQTNELAPHPRSEERSRWSVFFAPVQELLSLPLRFNEVLTVSEDDLDGKAYGDVLGRGLCSEVTLGQVIHSVLSELDLRNGSGVRLQPEIDPDPSTADFTPSPAGLTASAEPADSSPAIDAELSECWTAERLEKHDLLHGVGYATWAIRKGVSVTVGSLRDYLGQFHADMPIAIWSAGTLYSMISTDVRVMRYRHTGEQERLLICTLEPGEEVAPDIECAPWETNAGNTSASKHRRPGNRKRGLRDG